MDLEPKRDYIYVEDLVDALIKAIKIDDGYNIFNIGSGKSYSVGEIIRIIQEKAGTNLPVQSENISRDHEIYDIKADVTFAKNNLGWIPKHTFSEGIEKLLAQSK